MKPEGSLPTIAPAQKPCKNQRLRPVSESHTRGFLIGAFAGGVIGIVLFIFFDPKPPLSLTERIWSACMVPVVGGLLGGSVNRTMWLMVAGALFGGIILGVFCDVLLRRDLKSLLAAVHIGAALGAFCGYRFAIRRRSLEASIEVKPQHGLATGMWDREIDG